MARSGFEAENSSRGGEEEEEEDDNDIAIEEASSDVMASVDVVTPIFPGSQISAPLSL